MKIAIVQESLDPQRGGAETSVREMAACLRERNLEVTLVGPGEPAPDDPPHVHRIPVSGNKLLRAIRFVGDADSYVRNEGFDIVHAVSPCFSANVYQPRGGTYAETIRQTLARVPNPVVRAIKGWSRRFNRRQRFLQLTEEQLLSDRRRPMVAAVSKYVAEQIPRSCPDFPDENIRVVFNGVRIDAVSEEELLARRQRVRGTLQVADDVRVMLFAAHNFALKGLPALLEALRKLPDTNWQLWVVGRGKPPGASLLQRLGLGDRVRILGPRTDMHDLFAGADVLAHPTWYDPCSRVVLEALALGLPAVTTRLNGASEIMQPATHGLVIDRPDKTQALTDALQQALDPVLQSACRAAREETRQRVSMERHAAELEALYRDVVQA